MDDLRIGHGVTVPAVELRLKFSRSGGPGGQNVNKRDTRVEVLFDVAGSSALTPELRRRAVSRLRGRLDAKGRLRIVSSTERTQARNRERAIETLREVLAEALRPPPAPRRPTKPTKAARERRLASKRTRAKLKQQRARPDDY
jgi:ribosome-associated protein